VLTKEPVTNYYKRKAVLTPNAGLVFQITLNKVQIQ